MDLACAFLRIGSRQEFIDRAVQDYLSRLRQDPSPLSDAAALLDEQIRLENGNVTQLESRKPRGTRSRD